MKNLIRTGLAVLIAAVAFASCSDVETAKETSKEENSKAPELKEIPGAEGVYNVTGFVSLAGSSRGARTASSSFLDDVDWVIAAYNSSEKEIKPSYSSEGVFAFNFDAAGDYRISASLADSAGAVFCSGEKSVTISDVSKVQNITIEAAMITAQSDKFRGYGDVSLEIEADSSLNIATVNLEWEKDVGTYANEERNEWNEANLKTGKKDGTFSFESGTATIEIPEMYCGNHTATLTFLDASGNPVYVCNEIINVYSGFTTDTWYGSSPYISDGKFKLTSDVVGKMAKTGSSSTPVILWGKGYNVFNSIKGGEKIGDGFALDDGAKIFRFTIDPVTQKIYTIVKKTEIPSEIHSYDSYAGYKVGVKIAGLTQDEIDGGYRLDYITAYNGNVWVIDSQEGNKYFCKVVDSGLEKYTLHDEDNNSIDTTFMNSMVIAADSNYVYLAYTYSSTTTTYFEKYEITESDGTPILKRVAQLGKEYSDLGLYELGLSPDESHRPMSDEIDFSDIQLSSDGSAFYVLLNHRQGDYDSAKGGVKSRGGLLKISNTVSEGAHILDLGTIGSKSVFGWCTTSFNSAYAEKDSTEKTYLYGEGRFIAKKPDELVISDDGGYNEGENYNKNQVVKINLKDASMSVVDVNVTFGSQIQGTGFVYN